LAQRLLTESAVALDETRELLARSDVRLAEATRFQHDAATIQIALVHLVSAATGLRGEQLAAAIREALEQLSETVTPGIEAWLDSLSGVNTPAGRRRNFKIVE
jgi:predicted GTPase